MCQRRSNPIASFSVTIRHGEQIALLDQAVAELKTFVSFQSQGNKLFEATKCKRALSLRGVPAGSTL